MDKDEIEKIRPKARKLVIKSYIISLTHQMYRDIWLKLTMVIVAIQLILVLGGMFLRYGCGVETVSTTWLGAICSWACCLVIVIGNAISNKAMKNAQETKNMLYKLIDSYTNIMIIKTPDEAECEEYEDEE